MEIRGLDINAEYQEQAANGKFIGWRALKDGYYNFRIIWIKVAEALERAGYAAGAARCVAGAKSVDFEAINPYHYYLYRWSSWVGEVATWRVFSAQQQAQTFFDATKAANFPDGWPMMDWEDPLIDQFLRWSDTATLNAAIAFARGLNAHLKAYTYAIRDLFGKLPNAYSGKWWLDKWVPMLISNGYAGEVVWLKELYYILADYDGELNIPSYIPEDHVIAWQETSTPPSPVPGIPTGRRVPGDALDIDKWMRTDEEFAAWSGGEEQPTMTGTYKTDVPMKDRGHFVWLSSDDKDVDIPGVSAGSHAVFLRMCSQASGNMTVVKDGAFPIWVDRLTVPGVAVVEMDQNLFWNKEIPLPKFQARTMWDNETLRAIIDQWRSDAIPAAEWDAHKLNITAGKGWHKIGGLALFMSTTTAKGSKINSMWQAAIVEDITKCLLPLMAGGYIPTVPIKVFASWDWYNAYPADDSWKPAAWIAAGKISGVGLTRVYGQPATGLMTEVPMALPYAKLAEVWANVPADNYTYPATGQGVNFEFFVFSFNRLRATSVFYEGAEVTTTTAGIWCDVAENMGLGDVIVKPPPVDPPVDPEGLELRVIALEEKLQSISQQVALLNGGMAGVAAEMSRNFPAPVPPTKGP